MNKLTTTISLAVLASLLFILPAISQEDVMIIGGEDAYYGFKNPERAPVVFTHTAHMDLEMIDGMCTPCHHDGYDENGEFIEGDTIPCAECHDPEGGDMSLLDAYHKQCIECHEEAKQGPITCGECHVQKDFFGIPLESSGDEASGEASEG